MKDLLRLLAGLAWLAAVVVVFERPLVEVLRPAVYAAGLGAPASEPGFLLRATSFPPGGLLSVDGVPVGPLPMLANVACREGQPVRLEVTLEGHLPWQREIACREGETLIVRARLAR